MIVTLYTKEGCHLCEALKADLLALQPEIGFQIYETDIVSDQDLHEKYHALIPVLDIENGPLLYAPIGYDDLFQALDGALASDST